MAYDADTPGVHLGSISQHVPTGTGGVAQHRQGLHLGILEAWIVEGIGLGLAGLGSSQGESHETTTGQLDGKVAIR